MILLIPLIFAGLIAILGYRYIAPSQPEYPNARVITTFTLLGGSVGGVLLALAFWWLGDISRSYFDGDGDALLSLLYVGVLLGGGLGCLPAAVYGVLLAKKQLARAWQSSLIAAGYGAMVGAISGALLLSIQLVWVLAFTGGLSALVLSAFALPKAQ
nr:hypothetical protein [uncultured Kingella sp.]